MTLNEIRATLLAQHAALRAEIEEARRGAERWKQGDWSRERMQACLQHLAAELRAHNACEERLLREVIPTIDAWGQARSDVMTEVHLDEHRNLCAGLIGSTISRDAERGSATILLLLDAMVDHMNHEENIFLAADVLTDDIGPVDAFGG
jgi:Hemerythrin HHE cation binding domain